MYTSGQKKEEAKLSPIFLLLHFPQYFQHYVQEISFSVFPNKGVLLSQFPTTAVYNTCHCILQCTCHTCIFDTHLSHYSKFTATILILQFYSQLWKQTTGME